MRGKIDNFEYLTRLTRRYRVSFGQFMAAYSKSSLVPHNAFFNKRDKLALRRFLHVESDSSDVTLDVFGRFSRAFLTHPPVAPEDLTSYFHSRLIDPFATLEDVMSHLEVSHDMFPFHQPFSHTFPFKGEEPGACILTYTPLHIDTIDVCLLCYAMGEGGDVAQTRILYDRGSGHLVSEYTGQSYANVANLFHTLGQLQTNQSFLHRAY